MIPIRGGYPIRAWVGYATASGIWSVFKGISLRLIMFQNIMSSSIGFRFNSDNCLLAFSVTSSRNPPARV